MSATDFNGFRFPSIKLPSTLLKFPLFNYISFCKFPAPRNINKIISIVLKDLCNDHERNLLEQEIYKLFISQCKNVKYLYWATCQPLTLFPRASIFFSQLYHLYIDIYSVNSDAPYESTQICKDLNTLSISCYSHNYSELVIYLIDAQRNLKELNLYTKFDEKTGKELSKALVRNVTTTNSLHLNSIDNILLSLALVNLKNLSIHHWENHKEIQQHLATYNFPNLQQLSLIHCHFLSFKEISLLIEKTIGNISQINIGTTNKTAKEAGILIKMIANNCPKINYLHTYIEPKDFIHVKTLLLNCRSLEIIILGSLDFIMNENDNNIGDELLYIFILFSPKSLDEIQISGLWKYSINAFNQIFESFREQPLFRFFIIDDEKSYNYITDDHKIILKKYIDEGVVKRTFNNI